MQTDRQTYREHHCCCTPLARVIKAAARKPRGVKLVKAAYRTQKFKAEKIGGKNTCSLHSERNGERDMIANKSTT